MQELTLRIMGSRENGFIRIFLSILENHTIFALALCAARICSACELECNITSPHSFYDVRFSPLQFDGHFISLHTTVCATRQPKRAQHIPAHQPRYSNTASFMPSTADDASSWQAVNLAVMLARFYKRLNARPMDLSRSAVPVTQRNIGDLMKARPAVA